MPAILTCEIYSYVWHKDASKRAEIIFKFNTEGLIFAECKYIGVNKIYNLKDWEFLKDLSTEILRLSKEII